jgi:hypothetical protein
MFLVVVCVLTNHECDKKSHTFVCFLLWFVSSQTTNVIKKAILSYGFFYYAYCTSWSFNSLRAM